MEFYLFCVVLCFLFDNVIGMPVAQNANTTTKGGTTDTQQTSHGTNPSGTASEATQKVSLDPFPPPESYGTNAALNKNTAEQNVNLQPNNTAQPHPYYYPPPPPPPGQSAPTNSNQNAVANSPNTRTNYQHSVGGNAQYYDYPGPYYRHHVQQPPAAPPSGGYRYPPYTGYGGAAPYRDYYNYNYQPAPAPPTTNFQTPEKATTTSNQTSPSIHHGSNTGGQKVVDSTNTRSSQIPQISGSQSPKTVTNSADTRVDSAGNGSSQPSPTDGTSNSNTSGIGENSVAEGSQQYQQGGFNGQQNYYGTYQHAYPYGYNSRYYGGGSWYQTGGSTGNSGPAPVPSDTLKSNIATSNNISGSSTTAVQDKSGTVQTSQTSDSQSSNTAPIPIGTNDIAQGQNTRAVSSGNNLSQPPPNEGTNTSNLDINGNKGSVVVTDGSQPYQPGQYPNQQNYYDTYRHASPYGYNTQYYGGAYGDGSQYQTGGAASQTGSASASVISDTSKGNISTTSKNVSGGSTSVGQDKGGTSQTNQISGSQSSKTGTNSVNMNNFPQNESVRVDSSGSSLSQPPPTDGTYNRNSSNNGESGVSTTGGSKPYQHGRYPSQQNYHGAYRQAYPYRYNSGYYNSAGAQYPQGNTAYSNGQSAYQYPQSYNANGNGPQPQGGYRHQNVARQRGNSNMSRSRTGSSYYGRNTAVHNQNANSLASTFNNALTQMFVQGMMQEFVEGMELPEAPEPTTTKAPTNARLNVNITPPTAKLIAAWKSMLASGSRINVSKNSLPVSVNSKSQSNQMGQTSRNIASKNNAFVINRNTNAKTVRNRIDPLGNGLPPLPGESGQIRVRAASPSNILLTLPNSNSQSSQPGQISGRPALPSNNAPISRNTNVQTAGSKTSVSSDPASQRSSGKAVSKNDVFSANRNANVQPGGNRIQVPGNVSPPFSTRGRLSHTSHTGSWTDTQRGLTPDNNGHNGQYVRNPIVPPGRRPVANYNTDNRYSSTSQMGQQNLKINTDSRSGNTRKHPAVFSPYINNPYSNREQPYRPHAVNSLSQSTTGSSIRTASSRNSAPTHNVNTDQMTRQKSSPPDNRNKKPMSGSLRIYSAIAQRQKQTKISQPKLPSVSHQTTYSRSHRVRPSYRRPGEARRLQAYFMSPNVPSSPPAAPPAKSHPGHKYSVLRGSVAATSVQPVSPGNKHPVNKQNAVDRSDQSANKQPSGSEKTQHTQRQTVGSTLTRPPYRPYAAPDRRYYTYRHPVVPHRGQYAYRQSYYPGYSQNPYRQPATRTSPGGQQNDTYNQAGSARNNKTGVHRSVQNQRDYYRHGYAYPNAYSNLHWRAPPYPPGGASYPQTNNAYRHYPQTYGHHRPYPQTSGPYRSYPQTNSQQRSYSPTHHQHRSYQPTNGPYRSYPSQDGVYRSYPPTNDPYRSHPPSKGPHGSYQQTNGASRSYPQTNDPHGSHSRTYGAYRSYPPTNDPYRGYPPTNGAYGSYPPTNTNHDPYNANRHSQYPVHNTQQNSQGAYQYYHHRPPTNPNNVNGIPRQRQGGIHPAERMSLSEITDGRVRDTGHASPQTGYNYGAPAGYNHGGKKVKKVKRNADEIRKTVLPIDKIAFVTSSSRLQSRGITYVKSATELSGNHSSFSIMEHIAPAGYNHGGTRGAVRGEAMALSELTDGRVRDNGRQSPVDGQI